ncbi:panB 3-methyl-2-oxobutanoate hydroxymethyltransferase [Candida maltosa Xu316]|uniref:3-methyl-2-oxobutanoate hydroxymethyltransferase n=1 Tax=Candida maltosa (strain Xu316) TaxID=1245528 RepID=M3HH38_CANMX|nr:Likely ketopantoate hydroxymethyltransferase [Candida maltosa Xu316]
MNSFRSVFTKSSRKFSTASILRSSYTHVPRKTIEDIHQLYKSGEPISVVTSHDFLTSQILERAKVDINLIGDSLANTTLGYEDTNQLSLDEMLYHVKSVQRGNSHSLLVADMPFGSFECSIEQATQTAIKLVQQGKVQAVKIEGGDKDILPTIKKIISVGIPVMGHVGLTPQKHNALGGYKLQGRNVDEAVRILQECLNLQEAGVFAIVLECIPNKLAQAITEKLSIPTIGIGAGPYTSGQVLVISDVLGMKDDHVPKFVQQYANFFNLGVEGIQQYQADVKSRSFPNADTHGFKIKKEVFEQFKEKTKDI